MALEHVHSETGVIAERHERPRDIESNPSLPGKILMPAGRRWRDAARVIALIPDSGARPDRLAGALAALELPEQTEIVFISLAASARGSRQRRARLNAILSHARDITPAVSGQFIAAANWRDALRGVVGRRDMLVCLAGQHEPAGLLRSEPISEALLRAFQLPVFEVAGASPLWTDRLAEAGGRLLFELFPFAVVGSFLWAQIQLSEQLTGWAGTAALAATVIVEVGLIFVWSLFLD